MTTAALWRRPQDPRLTQSDLVPSVTILSEISYHFIRYWLPSGRCPPISGIYNSVPIIYLRRNSAKLEGSVSMNHFCGMSALLSQPQRVNAAWATTWLQGRGQCGTLFVYSIVKHSMKCYQMQRHILLQTRRDDYTWMVIRGDVYTFHSEWFFLQFSTDVKLAFIRGRNMRHCRMA